MTGTFLDFPRSKHLGHPVARQSPLNDRFEVKLVGDHQGPPDIQI